MNDAKILFSAKIESNYFLNFINIFIFCSLYSSEYLENFM